MFAWEVLPKGVSTTRWEFTHKKMDNQNNIIICPVLLLMLLCWQQGSICSTGTVRSRWEKHERACTAPEIYSKTHWGRRQGWACRNPSLWTAWEHSSCHVQPWGVLPSLTLWHHPFHSPRSSYSSANTASAAARTQRQQRKERVNQADMKQRKTRWLHHPDHPGELGYL